MGIKNLNRYFTKHCSSKAIRTINLDEIRHKTVVIDAYIYLYKYLGELPLSTGTPIPTRRGSFQESPLMSDVRKVRPDGDVGRSIENSSVNLIRSKFTEMINAFLSRSIKPIFVFDGKPPIEKQTVLQMRRESKAKAEMKYNQIINRQYHSDSELTENDCILLQDLKKKFVRIGPEHLNEVKDLMKCYNVEYVEAPHEADVICAQYVMSKKAWACVSDDMDMFVYGCTRVLRTLTIEEDSKVLADLYTLPIILCELHLTLEQLKDICVLSGTDYNVDDKICLFQIIRLFREYRRSNVKQPFYEWVYETTELIRDLDHLKKVRKGFVV